MKKTGKPVFFVVAIITILFTILSITGISSYYGAIQSVYIKGGDQIRWGIDIRGGVEVTFVPAEDGADPTNEELDGAALDFGALAGGNLAPMAFPWHLGQCLQSGYIAAAGQDGALEKVAYLVGYGEEAMTFEIWLDEGGLPVHCEVLYDGARCLTADITGFQWKA